jgi:hypothetical protein
MVKWALASLVALLIAQSSDAASQAQGRSVEYRILGCSDNGAAVRFDLADGQMGAWDMELYGSYFAVEYHLSAPADGRRDLSGVHRYPDGASLQYRIVVMQGASGLQAESQMMMDYSEVVTEDLESIDAFMARTQRELSAGTANGHTIECEHGSP